MSKVLVEVKTLSHTERHSPGRYDGFNLVQLIYKDHRRIKREKRRAKTKRAP